MKRAKLSVPLSRVSVSVKRRQTSTEVFWTGPAQPTRPSVAIYHRQFIYRCLRLELCNAEACWSLSSTVHAARSNVDSSIKSLLVYQCYLCRPHHIIIIEWVEISVVVVVAAATAVAKKICLPRHRRTQLKPIEPHWANSGAAAWLGLQKTTTKSFSKVMYRSCKSHKCRALGLLLFVSCNWSRVAAVLSNV